MGKRLKWDKDAKKQMREILAYYKEVANKLVVDKITVKIQHTVSLLPAHPFLGRPEPDIPGTYRSILAYSHYRIIYRIEGEVIYITGIWDCRQNPTKLKQQI